MHKTITGPVLGEIIEIECGEDMCNDCPNMDLYDDGKSERMHCTIFGGRLRSATDHNHFRLIDCVSHTVQLVAP
jgi:hypothetical protein